MIDRIFGEGYELLKRLKECQLLCRNFKEYELTHLIFHPDAFSLQDSSGADGTLSQSSNDINGSYCAVSIKTDYQILLYCSCVNRTRTYSRRIQ